MCGYRWKKGGEKLGQVGEGKSWSEYNVWKKIFSVRKNKNKVENKEFKWNKHLSSLSPAFQFLIIVICTFN